MKKLTFLLKTAMVAAALLCTNISWGQTTVFTENFGSSTSTNYTGSTSTPSATYTVKNYDGVAPSTYNETVLAKTTTLSSSPALTLDYNTVVAGTTSATGATQTVAGVTTGVFASPYTSILTDNTGIVTWTFNIKTSNTANQVGFNTGVSYGDAVVLASSSSNFLSGTGYVVTYERENTTNTKNQIFLSKFSAGVTATSLTRIIGSGIIQTTNTDYISVKVDYNPVTDTWSLSVRNDGASVWSDPTTGTTLKGSAIDATYVSADMPNFGFLFKHGTTAGVTAYFDNFKVVVGPVLATAAVTASTTALSGFSTTTVAPSATQSFNVTGTGLTANLIVSTTSTDFELSADNFATAGTNSINLGSGPTVTSTPINVRLKSGLTSGAKTGAVSVTSTGAPVITDVTCTGGVTAQYYYNATGLLSANTSWGVNTDGTGANPTAVTDVYSQFYVKNTSAVSTDASWTLGANSKVIVGDAASAPVTLTVASGFPIIGTIDVPAASSGSNSVLWQDATASPTFGTLDNTSEVHLQPSTAAIYNFGTTTYGKLFIDGSGQVSVFASSLTSTIKTSFTLAAGSFMDFPVQAITYWYVNPGATVTINGTLKTAKITGLFSVVASVQTANSYGNFQLNTTATLNLGSVSTIEYTKANSDQIISALPTGVSYNNLTISETGATATTTKTIPSPITVNGTLTINLAGVGFSSTTVGAANITLGDGATIVRMAGALNAAPAFGSTVNVTYNGATALASGVEIPASSSVLNNLTINKSGGVTLGSTTTTVNGTLALTAGTLDFGANTIILKGNITGTGSTSGAGGTIEFDGSAVQTNAATLSASTITINAAKQLTNNGTISATNFTVASSSAGTATFKNSGTLTVSGTSKVQQYLTNQSWYLTSPVWDGVDIQNTVTPTNLSRIQGYNEGVGSGNDWSVSGTTMKPYKGYITTVSDNPKTVEFTGKINSGNISIPLTRQGAGTENKYGFNLIGNPYTAYLDWKLVSAANNSKMPTTTMWYRTKVSGSWAFSTVDGLGNKVPANVSDLIPPMQAFWVRAANVGNSTLDLTTTMIAHDNTSTNKMKAPAIPTTERTKIRLQVSNGTNTDELLIYTDAQASNGFDSYDSPKMSNEDENIPEITTIVGSESLVINGLKDLVLDTEMPIRFMTKTANSFSLKSNEISNLPEGIKVILKDNGTEFDLTKGAEYGFSSDVSDNANRFSLLFRSPGASTDLENNKLINKVQVLVSAANQITIIAPEKSNYAIYNAVGQLIENGVINTKRETRNTKLKSGVYVVKVNNESTRVIIK